MGEKDRLDQITGNIIRAAIEIHKAVDPGLWESAHEAYVAFELRKLGYKIEQQKSLPLVYKDVQLDCGYRLDLIVEDSVIVEIKAIEQLGRMDEAQLISYFRLANKRVGLLINFHVRLLTNGVKRIVNDFPDSAVSAISAVDKN